MYGTQRYNLVLRLSGMPCISTEVVPTMDYLIKAQNQGYPGSSSIKREAKAFKSRRPKKLVEFDSMEDAKAAQGRGQGSSKHHVPRALPGSPMIRLGDCLSNRSLVALGNWYQAFRKAA